MSHVELRLPGGRVLGEMTITDLVYRSLRYLRAAFLVLLGMILVGALSSLIQGGIAYGAAYLLVVTGLLPPIALWIYSVQKNIPLVPSLALVNLVWHALPLASGNHVIKGYSDEEILLAAGEILIFGIVLTTVYLLVASTSKLRPREYYGFAISKFRSRRMLLGTAFACLIYCVIMEYLLMSGGILGLISGLPTGTFSIIRLTQEAFKLASGFVLGYAIGAKYITGLKKGVIIAGWMSLFILALASLLISSAAGLTIAIAAGLYLGSGRIPWKYIVSVLIVVSFFNYAKHEIRKKYWGRVVGSVQLERMPELFTEWSYLTAGKLFGEETFERGQGKQGLLERVSTFQMLLYVQRMVKVHQVAPLYGATYTMIPKLLVPRILWPEKPRTHEGQVLLNTHFRLQSESDTWITYIAWGLIAESYGNFGTLLGPVFLGLVIGGVMTSIEVWSGHYPLLSIRGAMATALLLQILTSYEMTAAIFITSSAQLLVIIGAASVLLAGKHQLGPAARSLATPSRFRSGPSPG